MFFRRTGFYLTYKSNGSGEFSLVASRIGTRANICYKYDIRNRLCPPVIKISCVDMVYKEKHQDVKFLFN
jgi:hypothetical protein